jgi:hypothetical protein
MQQRSAPALAIQGFAAAAAAFGRSAPTVLFAFDFKRLPLMASVEGPKLISRALALASRAISVFGGVHCRIKTFHQVYHLRERFSGK